MKKKILCLALVIYLILPYMFSIISHGAGDDVTFTISEINAARGETVVVPINMDCTKNFVAANFEVYYSSDNLEYLPYTENGNTTYTPNCGSTILSEGSPIGTLLINSAIPGELKIGYMSTSQPGVAGKEGDFLKLRFKVKDNANFGTSSISMRATTLKDSNGNDLDEEINDGMISILSGITMNNSTMQLTTESPENQGSLSVSPVTGLICNPVTWTSSNNSVATVEANSNSIASTSAQVTAHSAGTAIITASVGGVNATCTVTVTSSQPQYTFNINTPKWTFLPVSQIRNLNISFNPTTAGSGKTITWSSSNTAVATIDSTGKITALSEGTTTITAVDNNNVSSSNTYTLHVDGLLGDFDDDNNITSYDAYKALDLSTDQGSEISTPTADQIVVLDVDRDEDIKSNDAYLILKHSVGIINSF